jgi:hypothetical protein
MAVNMVEDEVEVFSYIIVTDMEGNIRIYRLPKSLVGTSRHNIALAGVEGNISFTVCTTTQGQSLYPHIALHISNYCIYCIEDQNLTHTI